MTTLLDIIHATPDDALQSALAEAGTDLDALADALQRRVGDANMLPALRAYRDAVDAIRPGVTTETYKAMREAWTALEKEIGHVGAAKAVRSIRFADGTRVPPQWEIFWPGCRKEAK